MCSSERLPKLQENNEISKPSWILETPMYNIRDVAGCRKQDRFSQYRRGETRPEVYKAVWSFFLEASKVKLTVSRALWKSRQKLELSSSHHLYSRKIITLAFMKWSGFVRETDNSCRSFSMSTYFLYWRQMLVNTPNDRISRFYIVLCEDVLRVCHRVYSRENARSQVLK